MDVLTILWGWFGGQPTGATPTPFEGIAAVRGVSITVPTVSALSLSAPSVAGVEILPA